MPNGVCPYCGQPMLMRRGVRLTPLLADIFDRVERAGSDGIALERLVGAIYGDKPTPAAAQTLKVNVHHLNMKLEETNFRVRMIPLRHGTYRLVKIGRRSIKVETVVNKKVQCE